MLHVSVLIGKVKDTIWYLQFNFNAKNQIIRDAQFDPNSMNRPIKIVGT